MSVTSIFPFTKERIDTMASKPQGFFTDLLIVSDCPSRLEMLTNLVEDNLEFRNRRAHLVKDLSSAVAIDLKVAAHKGCLTIVLDIGQSPSADEIETLVGPVMEKLLSAFSFAIAFSDQPIAISHETNLELVKLGIAEFASPIDLNSVIKQLTQGEGASLSFHGSKNPKYLLGNLTHDYISNCVRATAVQTLIDDLKLNELQVEFEYWTCAIRNALQSTYQNNFQPSDLSFFDSIEPIRKIQEKLRQGKFVIPEARKSEFGEFADERFVTYDKLETACLLAKQNHDQENATVVLLDGRGFSPSLFQNEDNFNLGESASTSFVLIHDDDVELAPKDWKHLYRSNLVGSYRFDKLLSRSKGKIPIQTKRSLWLKFAILSVFEAFQKLTNIVVNTYDKVHSRLTNSTSHTKFQTTLAELELACKVFFSV